MVSRIFGVTDSLGTSPGDWLSMWLTEYCGDRLLRRVQEFFQFLQLWCELDLRLQRAHVSGFPRKCGPLVSNDGRVMGEIAIYLSQCYPHKE